MKRLYNEQSWKEILFKTFGSASMDSSESHITGGMQLNLDKLIVHTGGSGGH